MDSQNENYLVHYGVLGMKWGIRRYQNKDGSLTAAGKKHYDETGEYGYRYKSWGTKHNERKLAKATAKGDAKAMAKYQRRADRSRELDRREENYARSVSAGGNLATRLLVSQFLGTKSYQQFNAMLGVDSGFRADKSNSAGVNAAKRGAAFAAAFATGRLGSTIAKAIYIRAGEKEVTRREA